MSLSWKLLNKENYELSTMIKEYDIAEPSVLHDTIRENAQLMYWKYHNSPSYYIPDNQHWDEYAQLLPGQDPPFHLDPHNIAYYHYIKVQQEDELQHHGCGGDGGDGGDDNDNDNDDDRIGNGNNIDDDDNNNGDAFNVVERKNNLYTMLCQRNFALAELIAKNNIRHETIIHQLIRRNASILYHTCSVTPNMPPKYDPGKDFWNETSIDQGGDKPPCIFDPYNIAYYHYLMLDNVVSMPLIW